MKLSRRSFFGLAAVSPFLAPVAKADAPAFIPIMLDPPIDLEIPLQHGHITWVDSSYAEIYRGAWIADYGRA